MNVNRRSEKYAFNIFALNYCLHVVAPYGPGCLKHFTEKTRAFVMADIFLCVDMKPGRQNASSGLLRGHDTRHQECLGKARFVEVRNRRGRTHKVVVLHHARGLGNVTTCHYAEIIEVIREHGMGETRGRTVFIWKLKQTDDLWHLCADGRIHDSWS
jgi:hypothetical protein